MTARLGSAGPVTSVLILLVVGYYNLCCRLGKELDLHVFNPAMVSYLPFSAYSAETGGISSQSLQDIVNGVIGV